ncbi:hypothetical protein BC829DRAFT_398176 [Chytridium lagenaria]|nr:hypothetical protein BC829DRAFT_398176 [Chytridium lagenaria]
MSLIGGLRITDLPREVLHRILIRLHPNQVQTASRILGVPEALKNLAPLRWNGVLLSKLNWVSLGKTYIAALLSSVLLCNGIIRIVFYNHKKFAERNNRRTNVYILTTDEQNLLLEASRVRRLNLMHCASLRKSGTSNYWKMLFTLQWIFDIVKLLNGYGATPNFFGNNDLGSGWIRINLVQPSWRRCWGICSFLDERCKHNNNHLHAERVLELVEVVVALVPITEGDGDRDVDNRSVRGVNWDVGMLLPNVCKRLLEVLIVESVVGRGLVDILEFILSHRRIGNDERVVAIKKAFYKAVSIQNGKMVDMLVDRFDALELVNEVKALDALLCVNPFAESMSFVNADAPGILRRLLQHPRVKVAEYLGMSGSRFFNTLEEDVLVQADLDPKFDLITQDNRFLHDFIRGEPALLFRLLEDERVSEVDRNYFKFRSACYQGDFEAVKTLVQDKGVDPSRHSKEVLIDAITKFQGQPPLCREQNKNIVNLLLRDERPNTVFEPTFLDSLLAGLMSPRLHIQMYAGDADEIRRLAKVHSNRTSAGLISVVSTFEEADFIKSCRCSSCHALREPHQMVLHGRRVAGGQDQQIEIGEDVADLFAETWRIEPELVNDVLCLASEVGLVEVLKRIVKKDDVKALGNWMMLSFRQHEVLEVLMEAFVGEI